MYVPGSHASHLLPKRPFAEDCAPERAEPNALIGLGFSRCTRQGTENLRGDGDEQMSR
jgi:hypothetical protein